MLFVFVKVRNAALLLLLMLLLLHNKLYNWAMALIGALEME